MYSIEEFEAQCPFLTAEAFEFSHRKTVISHLADVFYPKYLTPNIMTGI